MTKPDPEVDAILTSQLGDLARAVSRGPGGLSARSTAWTARRLRTETASAARGFDPHRGNELVQALAQLLDSTPEYSSPGERTGPATVRGIVGSGFAGMNPSYVLAVVDPDQGRLAVAAHAKEGLIKQHTAEKAVRMVLSGLSLD